MRVRHTLIFVFNVDKQDCTGEGVASCPPVISNIFLCFWGVLWILRGYWAGKMPRPPSAIPPLSLNFPLTSL